MNADTVRIEITTVSGTTRRDFNLRQLRRWKSRSIELVDTGLKVIIGAASVTGIVIATAIDSLPLEAGVYGLLGSALVGGIAALCRWAIKPERK